MNYTKIYELIIDRATNEFRSKQDGCLYENHHIIPKSVGGKNNKGNLVLLTPKEHYICHKLLVEIYKGTKFHNKMYFAMWCLINGYGVKKRHAASSKIYQNLKLELNKIRTKERYDNRKSIIQYDKQGNFVEKFNSIKEAYNKTLIGRKSIENCVRGESKSAGGFLWKFYKENNFSKIIEQPIKIKSGRKKGSTPWNKGKKIEIGCNSKSKKIIQYHITGEYLKEWDCISQVVKDLKINRDGIENCARGVSKSSGGYIWKYKNNSLNLLK
jgi:hypothetical protein